MQFKEFDWLSGHGIWAIIPCLTNMVSVRVILGRFSFYWCLLFYILGAFLRAAPRKYQLDLEIAKKSNFPKLAQNEALRALVTKILLKVRWIKNYFFYDFFLFDAPNQPKSIENERHIQRFGNWKVRLFMKNWLYVVFLLPFLYT